MPIKDPDPQLSPEKGVDGLSDYEERHRRPTSYRRPIAAHCFVALLAPTFGLVGGHRWPRGSFRMFRWDWQEVPGRGNSGLLSSCSTESQLLVLEYFSSIEALLDDSPGEIDGSS